MIVSSNSTLSHRDSLSASAVPIRPLPAPLAVDLSPEDSRFVAAAKATFRTLEADEPLYHQGDSSRHVYVLTRGWAFRYQNLEDGRRQILDFALPGAVFNFPGNGVLTHGVEALTDCTFSVFTREGLQTLLLRVPSLSLRLAELMAMSEARAFEHLTTVGRRTARERTAYLLIELFLRARRAGLTTGDASMTAPLRLAHLADALGLATETVCRTLTAMRREGVVRLRGRKLEVLDAGRLADEAGIDLDEALPWESIEPDAFATAALPRPHPVRPSSAAC
jgi:CRP-like cAMP-binding protein